MSMLPGDGGSSGVQIEDVPAMDRVREPWAVDAPEVVAALGSDADRGLDPDEARHRLIAHGPNELEERAAKSAWRLLAEQFTNAMILVLLGAAAITAAIGDLKDTAIILVIVALNGIIGFVQEYRAEQAMDALKRMTSPSARVVRAGVTIVVPAAELVPGDLVRLDAGDVVTADMRLIEARSLRINEAALTGELEPASKITAPISDVTAALLADQRNMAFSGTAVTYGRGLGLVVATGMQTALGRVAELLEEHGSGQTPLQRRLSTLGKRLAVAAFLVCIFVFVSGVARGEPADVMFLDGGESRGRGHPGRPAGRRDDRPGAGRPTDGSTTRARSQAAGGRDPRVGHRDLQRQDRHPDREPNARRAGLDPERRLSRERRWLRADRTVRSPARRTTPPWSDSPGSPPPATMRRSMPRRPAMTRGPSAAIRPRRRYSPSPPSSRWIRTWSPPHGRGSKS